MLVKVNYNVPNALCKLFKAVNWHYTCSGDKKRHCSPKETPMEVMKTINNIRAKHTSRLKLDLEVEDYRSLPIPGVSDAKLGIAYVKVTNLPKDLDNYMEVNPRVPSRSTKGILKGPIAKGILETLREAPEEMVLKNQGIYLLVESAKFISTKHDASELQLTFSDKGKHGIVNGGHTYAAIREAIESAQSDEELEQLSKAYVRLHIFENVDEEQVPEIAEGLNRSQQVDDPSLSNLQGEFDRIRKVMVASPGQFSIAYHQGDDGEVYISEILVILSMFNVQRFDDKKHPNSLYNRQALGLKYFSEDMLNSRKLETQLIEFLPEFLWLADTIRKSTPAAAKANGFKFGMAKIGNTRAGSKANKGIALHFLGEKMDYRVPNGWVYPMVAAFRANLAFDGSKLQWRVPLDKLLPLVIEDLVGVCVAEHKENNQRPDLIGKRESAYSQCYAKVQLALAKLGKLY